MEHFVEFEDVCKYYQTGSVKIAAADHLNFYVDKGEFCIIVGPSGAGKTTLLNILGGMDSCDEGNVWLDGQNVSHFTARELTTYRRYDVGFVFQFYNLVQNLTGALDYKTGKQVLALLQDTCRRTGRTVIVITHNTALTAMADRIIQVRSGKIVSNQVNEHPVPVQEIEW